MASSVKSSSLPNTTLSSDEYALVFAQEASTSTSWNTKEKVVRIALAIGVLAAGVGLVLQLSNLALRASTVNQNEYQLCMNELASAYKTYCPNGGFTRGCNSGLFGFLDYDRPQTAFIFSESCRRIISTKSMCNTLYTFWCH